MTSPAYGENESRSFPQMMKSLAENFQHQTALAVFQKRYKDIFI